MIPREPVMLLSFINQKLRDHYASLEELCDDMDLQEVYLTKKLDGINYHYDRESNQFI